MTSLFLNHTFSRTLSIVTSLLLLLPALSQPVHSGSLVLNFENELPGFVEGTSNGPSRGSCFPEDLVAREDDPSACEIVSAENAIRSMDGSDLLRLSTAPGGNQEDDLNQTRWRYTFEVSEPSALTLQYNFVTTDNLDNMDYFAILLDGKVLVCGDTLRLASSFRPFEDSLASGWRTVCTHARETPIFPGAHLLEAVVGDGTDRIGESSLLLDNLRLVPAVPFADPDDPCKPYPPEDVDEIPAPWSTPDHWTFDDNRFCCQGPGIACQGGGYPDVNLGTDFENSCGLWFEMYIVADCGTEMHVPLYDVEGGCVSVFDENGNPITIRVTNNVTFDQTGTDICWSADLCDPPLNNPGGPGNDMVMDVSFGADPALCGVYIIRFTSWAGCWWELFANCDGTNSPQFDVYDDFCEAQAAKQLLPEVIVENLVLSDGGGCTVDYCVDVRNVGCFFARSHIIRVSNNNDSFDHSIPGLASGASRTLCGNLSVQNTGPPVFTTVTAEADALDNLLECTESWKASSCEPASGGDDISDTIEVVCNRPPVCDANGPYTGECNGAVSDTAVQLDGTGSYDPDNDPLTYAWTTDCPGTFDNSGSSTPILHISGMHCDMTCNVNLEVRDPFGLSDSCSSTVTVRDTRPPVLSGVPINVTVECDSVPARATPTATDDCDSDVTITFNEARTDGPCPDTYTLTRTWTATDDCGLSVTQGQTIKVEDTKAPTLLGVPANVTVECDNVPVPARPTATDNCDTDVTITFNEARTDGPCPDTYTLTRTWTATDNCQNSSNQTQVVTVQDRTPPVLSGVPVDETVECDSVPLPATPLATDNCDAAPTITFNETRTDGPCEDNYTLTRTWTATDNCQNSSSQTQVVTVQDTMAPVLLGVPADETVECDNVPLPANPTATDNCDPNPVILFTEQRIDGDCPGNYTLTRRWTAVDRCTNQAFLDQVITVQDTTPPEVEGSEEILYCLWPPNHKYYCFDRSYFDPYITDNCSEPITWKFVDCASDQPDNAPDKDEDPHGWNGDGDTTDDCIVDPLGNWFCVRAERAGTGPTAPDGRRYAVTITATDACGNESDRVIIGYIYVPHDQSPTEDCLKKTIFNPGG
ncbi:hypothetical protein ACFLU6_01185 [Acidobacteriota bacterium]